jgi:hypothetical protein
MDLTRMLKNSDTARECELLFVVLSSLGLLCLILLYAACWSEGYISRALFLAALAYCVPGAILFFFVASLYFARWLFLSGRGGAKGAP